MQKKNKTTAVDALILLFEVLSYPYMIVNGNIQDRQQ